MNKTSSAPPIQVDPALRQAAEDVLADGESLSSFVEQSIRLNIRQRQSRKEFAERGMRAKERAEQTGILYSTEEVLGELDKMLEAGRKRRSQ